MNLHVPQSAVTEHELRAIAAVPYQIMSPKECKPLVAVVQDVALGIYRLTKKHVQLNEKQLFNLMSTNSRFLGTLPAPAHEEGSIKKWSGQQALSSIIPPTVNLRAANKSYDERIDDKDNFVIIENGVIKQGTVDKDIYQKRTKGLIHSIYNDCNEEETRQFFDNTQKLICNWLVTSGFSVGISDLIVDESTQGNLKSTINDMKVQVYDIIRNIHMNKFENLSINDNNEYFESEINKILNKAREQTGKLGLSKINDRDNRMINMIKSGSKGSSMNVAQMIACVGQQNVDGKRIAYGFDHRTLPHFAKYDDGPDSRGFVENSFIGGLTPQEFFFHSMGGREGLIDTAVKTAETGYLQRKLIKAMEDCKIAYDYTVRNASGSIIQFLYGEDGMNPIKIESQTLPTINMTYEQLYKDHLLSMADVKDTLLLNEEVKKDLVEDPTIWEQDMKQHFEDILKDREYMITQVFGGKQESTFMYPISFTRIINNAKAMLKKYGATVTSDLNPTYVLKTLKDLCKELYVNNNNPGNTFLQILLRCHLSPKQVMVNYRFNKDVFDHMVQQIKLRFYEAIASPSEMVGVVAAQSIGEPATQLTLNSVEWNTDILLSMNGRLERVKIGDFIDKIVDTAAPEHTEKHHNDTTLVWIKDKNVRIMSCNEDGKMSWETVEAVTQHPPINKDGTNVLLKVTLQSGREVIATKAKSFLKRHNNKIVEINGDELQVGDYLPVSSVLPTSDISITHMDVSQYFPNTKSLILNEELGFLMGTYAAKGYVSSNSTDTLDIDTLLYVFNNMMGAKRRLPAWVLQAPHEFMVGLISGYFSGVHTYVDQDTETISISLTSKGLLEDIQQVLVKYGIMTSINMHATVYKLNISCRNTKKFAETFKLTIKEKQQQLDCLKDKHTYFESGQFDVVPDIVTEALGTITIHREKLSELLKLPSLTEGDREVIYNAMQEDVLYDKVVSIEEYTSAHPYVYDFTVSNTKNFNIFNGLAMRDTFHHSGISSASKAVRGVPRIKELLSVTKNIKSPSMVIYLKDEFKRDKMASNKVLKSIHTTLFRDIVKSSKIYFDADDFNTDIEDDRQFVDTYRELAALQLYDPINASPWLLRIEIDREKLLDECLSMLDLYSVLAEHYNDTISCMFSDDNSNNLIFRIKLPDDTTTPDDDKDYITDLKALEKNIMDNTIIKGVKNIQKAIMNKEEKNRYNQDTMTFEKDFEWVISTAGTNMLDVLSHPGVEFSKTVSNDINETYELFGIEAARQALYNELFAVIDSAELYVNYRHLALLVDTMTNRGYLLSIDRHGINRVDFGPLAKCSFEETTDMLIKAGIFAEVDKINGVSANIMLGQIPPCGTGDCDVLIDEHKLMEYLTDANDPEDAPTDLSALLEDDVETACALDRMTFNFSFDATVHQGQAVSKIKLDDIKLNFE